MKERKLVWVFSLAMLDQSVQTIRLRGPFGYFPKDEYEFIYAPSLKAITNILRAPDIIVFQRILYPFKEMYKIMRFARSRGIPLVLEMDDLIVDVPPQHTSYHWHEEMKSEIKDLIRGADFITVTNNRLKEYLTPYNQNIHVVPNLINEDVWLAKEEARDLRKDKIVIGYAGSAPHVYDLKIVTPVIKHILSKYGERVCFKFIGCITEELKKMPGVYHIQEANPYTKYAQVMKDCDFDFVFAVLEDVPFGRAKSNIKFLEYSICGYPGIYSKVGPYIDSVTDGKTGLLVDNTTGEWIRAMELLINDPELRARLGRNAQEHVRAGYLLKDRASEWHRLYADIISPGRKSGPTAYSMRPLVSYGPYMIYAYLKKKCHSFLDAIRSLHLQGGMR